MCGAKIHIRSTKLTFLCENRLRPHHWKNLGTPWWTRPAGMTAFTLLIKRLLHLPPKIKVPQILLPIFLKTCLIFYPTYQCIIQSLRHSCTDWRQLVDRLVKKSYIDCIKLWVLFLMLCGVRKAIFSYTSFRRLLSIVIWQTFALVVELFLPIIAFNALWR